MRVGGKGGAGERSPSRLDLAGEAFLPSIQPSLSKHRSQGELRPEAAVSHSEGFHSCTGPELCVIQKLSKTMAIPLRKISFSVSVLLSITVVCRNTAAGNPGEEKKRERRRGTQVQVLVEVACGVPAF